MPVWNTGLTARKTANNAVYDRVLAYVGARPTDRDSVDRDIVSHVKAAQRRHHQLRRSERHHPLQSQCGRLALVCAAHAQAHAAVESEQCPRERLHQPRELAAPDGSGPAGYDFQPGTGGARHGGSALMAL